MTETFAPWPALAEIAEAVRAGRSSARAQATEALRRIELLNPALNAFVSVDAADAMARAEAVDRRVAKGEDLPLAGVPVAIKDNIWVKGRRITQGSHLFADFVAPEDAVAVARLVAAGAVVVGIANTAEFAAKGQTTNLLHGATRHPLDPALSPGGSSGGPVAAVAGGMVPFALGTDAGGSSRRPPAHTGLVGFKPSFGAIPYGPGFEEPFFGISCPCPIARTVAEAALGFEVMAGPSPLDPHSGIVEADGGAEGEVPTLAYSPKWGLDVPVDPEVSACVSAVVELLRRAGLAIVARDPVWPAGAAETGLNPLQHAGLAALYGEAWRKAPERIDPDLGSQISAGLGYGGTEVADALLLSERVAVAAARFFVQEGVDALIGPTTPCTAWPVEKLGPDTIDGVAVGPRGHAVFTPLFNHSRQPAISIPCGVDAAGLPIGLQIVMQRLKDRRLLTLAAQIEAVLAGARLPGSSATA
ncbi:amidase [Bosea sp. 124]|uniref:amidase n=1 Tax=Bosea sp. 124 TaxID=2135642 RepID=UPI000D385791|nr:amidase [Bosea sp. 124]PTM43319.1 aspartyl-tRNA(Asn)/glutamyl-tRNA(Gln) amidotransferase subunit A [Bosea sp. 124]